MAYEDILKMLDPMVVPQIKDLESLERAIMHWLERRSGLDSVPTPYRIVLAQFSRASKKHGKLLQDLLAEMHLAGKLFVFAPAQSARVVFPSLVSKTLYEHAEEQVPADDPDRDWNVLQLFKELLEAHVEKHRTKQKQAKTARRVISGHNPFE